jgi:hypothetical protein
MNDYLIYTGLIFLILFSVLSLIDGVYLHLIIYKLPEKNESRLEHLTHTLRAILFLPITLTIFYWNLSGFWLLCSVGIIALDLIVEAIDVLSERKSRALIGGLSSGEYLLHVALTSTRVAAISFFLASKPIEAWSTSLSLPDYPGLVKMIVLNLIPGAVIIAFFHIVLIFRPLLVSNIQQTLLIKRNLQK